VREIKFRGLRVDGGEWIYGSHQHVVRKCRLELIIDWDSNQEYEVNPNAVGQFTGLKDKNGKDIYEGDKLVTLWGDRCDGVVEYDDSCAQFCFKATHLGRSFSYDFVTTQSDEYEIVGNIHEDKAKEAGK